MAKLDLEKIREYARSADGREHPDQLVTDILDLCNEIVLLRGTIVDRNLSYHHQLRILSRACMEEWDCSAHPGHPGVQEAMRGLEEFGVILNA